MKKKYLIKVIPTDWITFFLDIVLYGEKDILIQKLRDIDFVLSLGIHESLFFEKFELCLEESIDFPEYSI